MCSSSCTCFVFCWSVGISPLDAARAHAAFTISSTISSLSHQASNIFTPLLEFLWIIQSTQSKCHWKLDLKSFPTSTHGSSYLSRINGYFFSWSDLVVQSNFFSLCVYLSTTNVAHLGSIKFSDISKLVSARNEVICCCHHILD